MGDFMAHEDIERASFYSNHSGTNIFFVLAYVAQFPLFLHIYNCIFQKCYTIKSSWMALVTEFGLIIAPLLLGVTLLADYTVAIAAGMTLLLICSRAFKFRQEEGLLGVSQSESGMRDASFISNFRGMLVLLTCIAILAVDFVVFPRYHVKTEEFGLSLMDIGTGGFIFSSGLTSRYARGVVTSNGDQYSGGQFIKVFTVFLLGVGRFLALQTVDYHEHVSEYGLHWNFFVTLAAVWALAAGLHKCVTTPAALIAIGLTLLIGHEAMIHLTEIDDFVLFAPREGNLFIANREGILSLPGFTALYILAQALGRVCIFKAHSTGMSNAMNTPAPAKAAAADAHSVISHVGPLAGTSLLLVAALHCCYIFPASRRLTNLPYIMSVFALCCSILVICAFVDLNSESSKSESVLFRAFSRNQLVLFLAANGMTGVVNLSVDTIHTPTGPAMGILTVYSFVLCLLAVMLHIRFL